jgi:hypothetical protein
VFSVELFYLVLLLSCGYAGLKGGAPERWAAAIFALAAILSSIAVATPNTRYTSVEAGVLAVDVAMLAALLVLATRAERFWPLWVTALHLIGTAGHAIKLADPTVVRFGYSLALALWSYPMLLLLVLGTWRHRKRLALHGADKSWSTFSSPSDQARRAGPDG